jgi:hypothetical protein
MVAQVQPPQKKLRVSQVEVIQDRPSAPEEPAETSASEPAVVSPESASAQKPLPPDDTVNPE